MDKSQLILLVLIGCIGVLNLLASFALIRDVFPTPGQRVVQFLLIWLLPVVGALIVLGVIASHRPVSQSKSLLVWPFFAKPVDKPGSNPGHGGACGTGSHGPEGGCGGD